MYSKGDVSHRSVMTETVDILIPRHEDKLQYIPEILKVSFVLKYEARQEEKAWRQRTS